ncbi:cartilage intermediate layer protein 1 [Lingula anatina]|uniref:Cartilage intermediate layer protein 1 n=1 Tax=Lingula anatina TaxID=7574 RepID=A0A1S3HRR3_LINAN|nr:cartilage intermediate layer protein 1 [Lingula anatina]|eukprot:XP_013387744.1 cartilage intermediate layer protein 1 [Lingula anatina]
MATSLKVPSPKVDPRPATQSKGAFFVNKAYVPIPPPKPTKQVPKSALDPYENDLDPTEGDLDSDVTDDFPDSADNDLGLYEAPKSFPYDVACDYVGDRENVYDTITNNSEVPVRRTPIPPGDYRNVTDHREMQDRSEKHVDIELEKVTPSEIRPDVPPLPIPKVPSVESVYEPLPKSFPPSLAEELRRKKMVKWAIAAILVVLGVVGLILSLVGVFVIAPHLKDHVTTVPQQKLVSGLDTEFQENNIPVEREEQPEIFKVNQGEPIHGQWTRWDPWGGCSTTCGQGVQVRRRTCSDPAPHNGGLDCAGPDFERRNCSDWPCPDCNKPCPAGATLVNCSICVCNGSVLYGRVTTTNGIPLNAAAVFHQDKQWEAITMTNQWGEFSVPNVCTREISYVIRAPFFFEKRDVAIEVNNTHARLNVSLSRKEPPEFTDHPFSTAALVGQSVTFCCNATAHDEKLQYLWYKDNRLLEDAQQGAGNVLTLGKVTQQDSGSYQCQAVSPSGKTMSKPAVLTVYVNDFDACSRSLTSKKVDLLPGCHVNNSVTGARDTTIDIGECAANRCVLSSEAPSATCNSSKNSSSSCCKPKETETINVTCNDGTQYVMYKITSCGCVNCFDDVTKAFVSGIIYGKKNNEIIPLQYGTIYYKGKQLSKTTSDGKFHFRVPEKVERFAVEIKDGPFRRLSTTVKVLQYQSGLTAYQSIKVPLNPDPVVLTLNKTNSVNIIGSDSSPLGTLKVDAGSVVDKNGKIFSREARLLLSFQDTRDLEGITESPGEFVTMSEEGETDPLRTFGTFSLRFEDTRRNQLFVTKPIQLQFDPDKVKAMSENNELTDVKLWGLDKNTGAWVEVGPLSQREDVTEEGLRRTGRRLLQTQPRSFIAGTIPTPVLYDYYNLDIRENNTIQCHVKVGAYDDVSKTSPVSGLNAYILTKSSTTGNWIGYSRTCIQNGKACLRTFCPNAEGFIFSEAKGPAGSPQRLLADISDYNQYVIVNHTDVYYESPRNVPSRAFYRDLPSCYSPESKDHLKFYVPVKRECSVFRKNEAQWKVPERTTARYAACFVRVKVMGPIEFKAAVIASSELNENGFNTEDFGTATCDSDRAARSHFHCLEFRCAGDVIVPGDVTAHYKPRANITVTLKVSAKEANTNRTLRCIHRSTHSRLGNLIPISSIPNTASFLSTIGDNFGFSQGIPRAVNTDYEISREDAKDRCENEAEDALEFYCLGASEEHCIMTNRVSGQAYTKALTSRYSPATSIAQCNAICLSIPECLAATTCRGWR